MRIASRKALAIATLALGMSFSTVSVVPAAALAAPAITTTTTTTTTVQKTTGVNWEKGKDADVVAVGVGFPPPNTVSAAQGKELARRAAIIDAQRNLLEVINGVSVDAETTVANLMVVSDTVRTRVSGLVKGATIVGEQYNANGSYQVVMRIPVYGVQGSLSLAILEAAMQRAPMPAPAPLVPSVMGAYSTPDEEAAAIIESAKAEAAEIVASAKRQADAIVAQAKLQTPAAAPAQAPVTAQAPAAAQMADTAVPLVEASTVATAAPAPADVPVAATAPEEPVPPAEAEAINPAEAEAINPAEAEATNPAEAEATNPAEAEATNPAAPAATAAIPAAAPQPQMTVLNAAELKQLDAEKYTGVIIDATGLGMEPTFAPVIYDTEKRPIYGLKNLDYKWAMNNGMVGYASSVEAAKTLPRAGSNPLILKATDATGGPNSVNRVNVVVSVADGDRILLADQKNAMLNKASVIFVK